MAPWCFGGPTQLTYSAYREDQLSFHPWLSWCLHAQPASLLQYEPIFSSKWENILLEDCGRSPDGDIELKNTDEHLADKMHLCHREEKRKEDKTYILTISDVILDFFTWNIVHESHMDCVWCISYHAFLSFAHLFWLYGNKIYCFPQKKECQIGLKRQNYINRDGLSFLILHAEKPWLISCVV